MGAIGWLFSSVGAVASRRSDLRGVVRKELIGRRGEGAGVTLPKSVLSERGERAFVLALFGTRFSAFSASALTALAASTSRKILNEG
jgi:hypothetical protein